MLHSLAGPETGAALSSGDRDHQTMPPVQGIGNNPGVETSSHAELRKTSKTLEKRFKNDVSDVSSAWGQLAFGLSLDYLRSYPDRQHSGPLAFRNL